MKIAVLGATGLIGHHTALAALDFGHEVVCIVRSDSNRSWISDLPCEVRVADLDDKLSLVSAFKGVDGIIHCASYYPTKRLSMLEHVVHATTQTEYFYEACATAGISKIVYVGAPVSLKLPNERDNAHADSIYSTMPPEINPYLRVKWAMDVQAQQKAKQGVPVVIGVPATAFGEFDFKPSTGRIITNIANATLSTFVPGKRNIVYAGDAARGLMLALEKGKVGERYVFTGQNIRSEQLVRIIAKQAGVAAPVCIPMPMAKLIVKFQETKHRFLGGKPPPFDSTALYVFGSDQFLDGQKAQDELDYRATVSIEDTISISLKWFKENGYISGISPTF